MIESNPEQNISLVSSQQEINNKLFISQKNFDDNNTEEKKDFLGKKKLHFKVEKESLYDQRKSLENMNSNEGRWSKEEHIKFLKGIVKYGINWKKVKTMIDTRTSIQVRSHAQKFFRKLKYFKDDKLGIDFTLDSIRNIKDMTNQIKSLNLNYDFIKIYLYISNRCEIRRKTKTFDEVNNNAEKNIINNINIDLNNLDINNINSINNFINNNKIFNEQHIENLVKKEINFTQQINNINYNFPINNFSMMNSANNIKNMDNLLNILVNNALNVYKINNNILNNYIQNMNNAYINNLLANSVKNDFVNNNSNINNNENNKNNNI